MNLDCRKWILAVLLGLLAFLPNTASAGMTLDEVKAFEGYKAKAYQGNAGAQFGLGFCYTQGQGVAKDAAEGVKWYRKAADQGNASAQANLGFCYCDGEGVAKDFVQAVAWYRKAADQGVAGAQYNLGFCYFGGHGVTKDATEAVKWYRKAADQGYPDAQYYLALCYANGQGVAKDNVEAVKWYRRAADQGDARAQFMLGNCYANGEGVAKDNVEAAKWNRKAADQGLAVAQSNNSLDTQQYEQRSFLVGDTTISLPIPKNYREADRKVRWVAELNKISEQGHADPSQNFHVLINLLTKKPGIPANIEASPQDFMDCFVMTSNEFDNLKCPLEDFSKEMKTFETQLTGGNSDKAWKELVQKTFEQNRFVGAEAKAVAASFGKPTCIERTSRHVIAVYPGERVVTMSMVLNRGKILYIYISKTESEILAGIREMKGWVAEIENTTPAEGEVPSRFWNAIVEGGARGVAYFVFSSVIAAIIFAFKKSRKQSDKEVPNQPPPL